MLLRSVLQLLMSCWLGKILCYEDSFSVRRSYLVVKQTIYYNHSERVSAIEISIICECNSGINDTMPTIIMYKHACYGMPIVSQF